MGRRIIIKDASVLLSADHFRYHAGRIITAYDEVLPEDFDGPIVITRGYEQVENGVEQSRHLECKAFDFRVWHISNDPDFYLKLSNDLRRKLGSDYYVYLGHRKHKIGKTVYWIHAGFNRD